MAQVLSTIWSNHLIDRVALSNNHFFARLQLSFLYIVQNFSIDVDVAPRLFSSKGYRMMLGFWMLWKEHDRKIAVEEFNYYYYSYF